MKVTVLGCGALGQLWLASLYKYGLDVQGWLRIPRSYCMINLIEKNGNHFSKLLKANDPNFLAKSDLLLVTLKAWQVSKAVKNLTSILPLTSPILLLHNGMGTLDELKSIKQPLIVGTTTHAVKRDKDIVICTATSAVTHIGPAKKLKINYSYLRNVLHAALPDVIWHNIIKPQLWLKLAVNCIVNPLTALLNCPNGILRNHLHNIEILCLEISRVIKKENLHFSVEDLYFHVENVIINTAENISSMLHDIRALKQTEIDYISGYLIKRAHAHNISIPENARLYNLIKRKERKYKHDLGLHHL